MRFSLKAALAHVVAFFVLVVLSSPSAAITIHDLAGDWSDVTNPNGVWSYNSAPGTPITNHLADWDPGASTFLGAQPAWAAAALPNPGHVPMWLLSVGTGVAGVDLPAGRVGMHGSHTTSVGVTWTSPFTGVMDISGGTWQFYKLGTHAIRSMTWEILLNGAPLTSGVIQGSDAFSSASPFDFSAGSGGAGVLQGISVNPGDVVTLQYTQLAAAPTFAGADLTITVVPEPGTVVLVASGLLFLGIARRRWLHNR